MNTQRQTSFAFFIIYHLELELLTLHLKSSENLI